jgi:hypothetical protein
MPSSLLDAAYPPETHAIMRCIPSSQAKENLLKATACEFLASVSSRELTLIPANDEIDKRIYLDFLKTKNEINILLLGAGGAEQSVLRQLRLLHPPALTNRERNAYKKSIFSNIAQDMRFVVMWLAVHRASLKPILLQRSSRGDAGARNLAFSHE